MLHTNFTHQHSKCSRKGSSFLGKTNYLRYKIQYPFSKYKFAHEKCDCHCNLKFYTSPI